MSFIYDYIFFIIHFIFYVLSFSVLSLNVHQSFLHLQPPSLFPAAHLSFPYSPSYIIVLALPSLISHGVMRRDGCDWGGIPGLESKIQSKRLLSNWASWVQVISLIRFYIWNTLINKLSCLTWLDFYYYKLEL